MMHYVIVALSEIEINIFQGMEYIHGSVETHGRLKSSNVFIDAQWTCKVGDIAMPVFRDGEKSGSDTEPRVHYRK